MWQTVACSGRRRVHERELHTSYVLQLSSYFTVAASGDGGGYDLRDGASGSTNASARRSTRPTKGRSKRRPTPAPSQTIRTPAAPPSPRGTEGTGLHAVSRAHRNECPLPRDSAGSAPRREDQTARSSPPPPPTSNASTARSPARSRRLGQFADRRASSSGQPEDARVGDDTRQQSIVHASVELRDVISGQPRSSVNTARNSTVPTPVPSSPVPSVAEVRSLQHLQGNCLALRPAPPPTG